MALGVATSTHSRYALRKTHFLNVLRRVNGCDSSRIGRWGYFMRIRCIGGSMRRRCYSNVAEYIGAHPDHSAGSSTAALTPSPKCER